MIRNLRLVLLLGVAAALWLAALPAQAAKAQVLLPLNRTAYQTNEQIDIAVVRSDAQALPAGVLTLTVTGADASKMVFTFPVGAVPVANNEARATENLHVNGWLLRPGAYTVDVTADGATAQAKFTVYSHVRKSLYKTVHWGGSRNDQMLAEGVDGMGFNVAMGETGEAAIPSGQDVMGNCLMGGGHQHDLRLTNDWADPNVYLGAIQRGVDRAFGFRTMPNAIGAHLHDEPGLTWLPHPYLKGPDGKPLFGPHDIAFQRNAYQRAFNEEMPWFDKTANTKDPVQLAQWQKVCEFKLGFMDAMWKASRQDLERLKPGYLAITQSQYGWTALHDGYYFNVARSMPVISGHGGYNDFWLRNFNPSFFLEFALPRQLDKPTWYLPEWYNMTPESFREEHNLSFIAGVQGMSTPPGLNAKSPAAPGITESNKLFARLGTIFVKPAYTRQDLAILYSRSNIEFHHGDNPQPGALAIAYLATRLTQYPMTAVLDEDILDGTVAASHKAVLLIGIEYLDPAVIAGLEAFVKGGGTVLATADCKAKVAGATVLDVQPEALWQKAQKEFKVKADAQAAKKKANASSVTKADEDAMQAEGAKVNSFRAVMEYTAPTAKALKAALLAKGIRPTFESSVETICAGKQVRGEIEYDFAVNFTPEAGYGIPQGGYGNPVAAKATIALPDDGRPVYEAVSGAPAKFAKQGQTVAATLDFGPGQLLAFARTARPIGGVQVGLPVINRDFTRDADPLRVELTATLMDANNGILAGTAPLQITVTDPLGVVRYDLYRATESGVCALALPLAANDPAGKWTVTVKELLSGKEGRNAFTYGPAAQCGVLAGATPYGTYFWADKENIYSFFRNHRQLTIVKGASDYDNAAADRLVAILKPYNVTAKVITAADANKPRPLSDEDAKTWCGDYLAGLLDDNARKSAPAVGFDLPTPVIVLGNAQDNPLIAFLTKADRNVLPYALSADSPGRGHGLVAWNVQTLGHDVEAVVLLANDAAGMNEAVGTAFMLGVGLDPLTPVVLPASSAVTPATAK